MAFDFYRIDSWDDEKFRMYLNDQLVLESPKFSLHRKETGTISGSTGGISWTMVPDPESYGKKAFGRWNEQTFAVTLTIPPNNSTESRLTIKFGSTLDGGISDESWGIDNFALKRLSACETCAIDSEDFSAGAAG